MDAELELFQAQQDGSEEAVELQKKVNLLRLEAARTGKLPTSLSPRGGRGGFRGARGVPRGSYFNPRFRGGRGRGRGRGFAPTTSFDRRPSKILVAGFEEENKDSVLEHFKKFGEILDIHDGEDDGLSTIIHYKSRREAELAMNGGKNYGEAALQLSWFTGVIPSDSYHSELSSQISNDSLSLSGLEEPTEAPTEELGTYLPDLNADEDKEKAKGVSVKEEIKQEAGGDNEEEEDPEAVTAQVTEEEADQLLYDDDETEEDDERSWKR